MDFNCVLIQNMCRRINFFLKIAIILPFLTNSAYAAYSFDKVRIALAFKSPVDTIRLGNPGGDQPVNLQISVVKWTQNEGKDIYEATKDIIISPPIMNILPNKSQITRVGWRVPRPIQQELAYRMTIQDLTPYKQKENVISFKVQASIPIFIVPDNPIVQAKWTVQRAGNKISVTNTGNVHIQVKKITLSDANNNDLAATKSVFYVLPKKTMMVSFDLLKSLPNTVVLTADTDNGKLVSTVPVM